MCVCVPFNLRLFLLSFVPEIVAVIVKVLRQHASCRTHPVPQRGAMAINDVACSDREAQQRFVAAGARAVLEAIRDDPASGTEAKKYALDALEKLQ